MDAIEMKTFNVDFSGEGMSKFMNRLKEKLREFLGDCTDDILVEYVIVLLKNGRHREEARHALDVFLGDDSHSFVSWLWDHLDSNLDTYVEKHRDCAGRVTRTMSTVVKKAQGDDSHHLKSDLDRKWKGIDKDVDGHFPFGISQIDRNTSQHNTLLKVRRDGHFSSSKDPVQRKRDQHHGKRDLKREPVSQVAISAPQRILQSAVRDALEPQLKRLRSIVLTSTSESSVVPTQPIEPTVRVPNSTVTVIKPVAEAVDGVNRVKHTSVFDRLGPAVSETGGHHEEHRKRRVLNGENINMIYKQEQFCSKYIRCDYDGQLVQNITRWGTETGLDPDAVTDNKGYNSIYMMGNSHRQLDVSNTKTSNRSEIENLALNRCDLTNNAGDLSRKARSMEEQRDFSGDISSERMNISVNVNTWKPDHDHHKERREVAIWNGKKTLQEREEDHNTLVVGHENVKSSENLLEVSQNSLSSATSLSLDACPSENADSRTIFVTNVHFAATKDGLSHHFNKFGEVLKVETLTDSTSGRPIGGSAYLEFKQKESAENALSLDGTPFMSRILKVTRRAASPEVSHITTWPHIDQSPYAAAMHAKIPFPAGVPGASWRHPTVVSGARSLQWKRDTNATPGDRGASVFSSSSSTARSFTYIRPDLKP